MICLHFLSIAPVNFTSYWKAALSDTEHPHGRPGSLPRTDAESMKSNAVLDAAFSLKCRYKF